MHPVATAIIGHLHPWKTVLAARATCRTFRRAIESYMKGEGHPTDGWVMSCLRLL